MSQIELVGISKSYDKQQDVLNEINLTIEEGEFFVLVGPSGSGKSTLLRMIAGLEEISGGTLKINDKSVNHILQRIEIYLWFFKIMPLSTFISKTKYSLWFKCKKSR